MAYQWGKWGHLIGDIFYGVSISSDASSVIVFSNKGYMLVFKGEDGVLVNVRTYTGAVSYDALSRNMLISSLGDVYASFLFNIFKFPLSPY